LVVASTFVGQGMARGTQEVRPDLADRPAAGRRPWRCLRMPAGLTLATGSVLASLRHWTEGSLGWQLQRLVESQ